MEQKNKQMKFGKIIIIFAVCALLAFALLIHEYLIRNKSKENLGIDTSAQNFALEKHNSYSSDKAMYGALEKIKEKYSFTDYLYGGIVSHHLLAAVDIAQFYASFSKQKIDTVILIGPNHEGRGNSDIAVSNADFSTPWGDVEIDREIVKSLAQSGVAKINEAAFVSENSVSVEAPYIKYYFPKAKLVPIVLKRSHISKDDLLKLVNFLSEIKDKKIVVIASVDFSHHTGRSTALGNDKKSIKAISAFDTDNLYGLNIDSPSSIFVLLNYLKNKEAVKMDFWQQNAADILNSLDYKDVTSYLFAVFRK